MTNKKMFENLKSQAIKDCLTYHKDMIKEVSRKNVINKSNVVGVIEDFDLDGYEDIAFFIGYFRALEDVKDLI
jgi:hypothetical protein